MTNAAEHQEVHQVCPQRTIMGQRLTIATLTNALAYPLVEIITSKLHSRVRYNANAVCAVSCHEPTEAFFTPHLPQRLAYRHFVFFASDTLNLEENLQALKR